MEATPKHLIDYETTNGKKPFREWLDDLDFTIAFRIQTRINRVAIGNLGDVKPVGQGVSELRVKFGAGYRVYFAQHGEDIIILLCGGDKDTQSNDIETAKTYWSDYKRRNNA